MSEETNPDPIVMDENNNDDEHKPPRSPSPFFNLDYLEEMPVSEAVQRGRDHDKMHRQLCDEAFQLQYETDRIADELAKQSSELEKVQKRNEEQAKISMARLDAAIEDLRRNILLHRVEQLEYACENGPRLENKPRRERQLLLFPATVLKDIEAIEFLANEQPDRLPNAIKGFDILYGISYEELEAGTAGEKKKYISSAPEKIIQVINKRADFDYLPCYLHATDDIDLTFMRASCDIIIELWRSSKINPQAPDRNDELVSEISKLDRMEQAWEATEEGVKRFFAPLR